MRKLIALTLLITFLVLLGVGTSSESSAVEYPFKIDAKSAILMDSATGTVLFEQDADLALPPASVTKIMTLLLVMEAIEEGRIALDDLVAVSEEAASMGGSQVYLEPGEAMKLEEMIKCVVIASANDAAFALAEHVAGSEEAFVKRMNERAAELGMKNTHFENTNGLDDTATKHLTSARDIAIMSCELLKHKKILEYTTIWMDSIRDGSFVLTNTNRLVRFYPGATGLKTGSTSKALFCISATAERDGTHLVAVIMGAPTRDIRNAEAKKLLDFGFANYASYHEAERSLDRLGVVGGNKTDIGVKALEFSALLKKGEEGKIEKTAVFPSVPTAPIQSGDVVGYLEYKVNGETIGKTDIVATEDVRALSFWDVLASLAKTTVGAFEKRK